MDLRGGVWLWGDDYGGWNHMMPEASDVVEHAFNSNQPNVQFQLDQGVRVATYNVDFSSMTQSNQQTGFRRAVRRTLSPNAPDPANVWSWQDDSGQFTPMERDHCAYIDIMRSRGARSCIFWTDSQMQYMLDFQTMSQVNALTGKVRAVQSSPVGAGPVRGGGGGGAGSNVDNVMAQCRDVTSEHMGDDDLCPVCHEGFTCQEPALQLPLCQHYFHGPCVRAWLVKVPKCPVCNQHYAPTIGNMPPGHLQVEVLPAGRIPLSSFEHCGTIRITYSFSGGSQTAEHPSPGRRYSGTRRTCYLPDNDEGRLLVPLLQRAWDQRLMFTIGTSLTTGMSDCIIWNGIHMKTSPAGGPQSHGYPDPDYFGRLREELKAKGIQ